MSDSPKAVFLSYASLDAEAARRIADSLRASGVEVWFDQSELRGGDAWDQKIRKQIKDCALFVPVISANTQSRAEGYFRLEWKLAVDRSHLLAEDHPFLFPIALGDVNDATARVPEKFRDVQWTRLRLDETPTELAARVARLLAGAEPAVEREPTSRERAASRSIRPQRKPLVRWLALGLGGLILAVLAISAWRSPWRNWEDHLAGDAAEPAALSEAGRLAARARTITVGGSLTRAQLDTAAQLCGRAIALDPTEAAAWTEAARVDLLLIHPYGYDRSDERRKQALARAARAIALAPASFDARIVQAAVFAHASGSPALRSEAEKTIRELIAAHPADRELKVQLAEVLREQERFAEAAVLFESIGEHEVAGWSYYQGEQPRAALAAVNLSLEQKRAVTALQLKALLQSGAFEDLDAAQATVDQLQPSELLAEMPAAIALQVATYRRDSARILEIAQALPQDYLDSNAYRGPRQYFTGLAHELAGRAEVAAVAWRASLAVVDERLKTAPDDRRLLLWQAWLHASLDHPAEAERLLARARLLPNPELFESVAELSVSVALRLGHDDVALDYLAGAFRAKGRFWESVHAEARFSPAFDRLRGDPRFEKLLRDNLPEGAIPFDAPKPSASAPPADPKSVAVLPFANLSPDPENAFFCDGVHDDVITVLAKIRDLRVISRTSTLAYRDAASRNLKKIAAELGVANVLEGSVRRAGNKVRVSAQLIDARTDAHVWAETYDGDLTDIFALQAKLAQQIAGALQATLTGSERALIERRPTENQEAYDLFLRARAMQQEQGELGSLADFERIVTVYDQAIAKDPAFALAYAQVAQVLSIQYWFGFLDPSPARAERMKAAVDAAVRLAPDAPETHVALGSYHYRVSLDWNRALAEFRLAETGLPNDPQLRFWLAITHRRLGHWTESANYFAQSVALNPRDLASVSNYILYLSVLRRWDLARTATDKALTYFPTRRELLQNSARVAFALDRDATAYARAMEKLPPSDFDPAGATDKFQAALLRGDLEAARQALEGLGSGKMLEWYGNVISDPVTFHQTCVAFLRGDHDSAGRLADQAIAYYRGERWNTRQQPWVQMRIAQLEAWAGRGAEALRDGEAALDVMLAQDALGGAQLLEKFGTVLVSLDRRDEALARLRQVMAGPCTMSPNEFRVDPLWSRLQDDPRFEEILQAAKPL